MKFFKEAAAVQELEAHQIDVYMQLFLESLSDMIVKELIWKGKAMLSSSIMELYRNEYLCPGGTTVDIACYTAQALMKKIKGHVG